MENDEKCLSLNAGGSRRCLRLDLTRLDSTRFDSTRCGSQLSHNLKLSPNEARESRPREERGGIRGPCRSHERNVYEGVTKGRKKTRRRRRKGHELERVGGREPRGTRIVWARAINTRITISATNVPLDFFYIFPAPLTFSYPCGHDVHVHTFSALGLPLLTPHHPRFACCQTHYAIRVFFLFLSHSPVAHSSHPVARTFRSFVSFAPFGPPYFLTLSTRSHSLSSRAPTPATSPTGDSRGAFLQRRYARTRQAQLGSLY